MGEPRPWTPVPFHFWTVVFFVLGSMVGSFLNVCIHRLPRGLSLISPPSHCPACGYAIPWYRNIPLFAWLGLRGRCAACGARIAPRYFLVELLTAILFAVCWIRYGDRSPLLVGAYCVFLAGLIAATFIDFEHFIIPDEITIGGTVAGFLFSLAVPMLHEAGRARDALRASGLGILVGGLLIYAILRLGKLAFGRQNLRLPDGTRILFSETGIHLPDREIPFEEVFYRRSDCIRLQAATVELADRCHKDVAVRLTPASLEIGGETYDPASVSFMEVVANEMVLPREAMGLGDVKFMMAIGAFIGWAGVLFSLMLSAVVGAMVGVTLILCKRRDWSSRLPYGPYIAIAAVLWIFGGREWVAWWFAR